MNLYSLQHLLNFSTKIIFSLFSFEMYILSFVSRQFVIYLPKLFSVFSWILFLQKVLYIGQWDIIENETLERKLISLCFIDRFTCVFKASSFNVLCFCRSRERYWILLEFLQDKDIGNSSIFCLITNILHR